MRAVLVEAVGGSLTVAEVPRPTRGPGEALVRMDVVSLNPVEAHIWAGRFFEGDPRVPYIPGVEGVGVVEEGDHLPPGTRVRVEVVHPGYGRDGLLAEYAVVPEGSDARNRASQASAFPLPSGIEPVAGAALGATGFTAVMLLDRAVEAGATVAGAHIAVLAGTGAVGLCVLQLSKVLGAARVIAVGRNAARLERARELGADATVALGGGDGIGDLRDRLLDAAGGRLDIVMDPLWGDTAVAAIDALGPEGVYVNFGQVTSTTASLPSMGLRNKRITLVGLSGAVSTPAQRRSAYERAHELAAGGRVVLDIEELSLDDVPAVWDRLTSTAGSKLVVRIPRDRRGDG